MVNTKSILVIGLSLLAAAAAFIYFFQSDAHRIKKQLEKIAETVEKTEPESDIAAGVAARRISRMFAESCLIEAPSRNISRSLTPDDIAAYVMSARRHFERIEMDFYDIEIEFPREDRSELTFTTSISARRTGEQTAEEIHEIACKMKKIERDWVFYEIAVVTVLER